MLCIGPSCHVFHRSRFFCAKVRCAFRSLDCFSKMSLKLQRRLVIHDNCLREHVNEQISSQLHKVIAEKRPQTTVEDEASLARTISAKEFSDFLRNSCSRPPNKFARPYTRQNGASHPILLASTHSTVTGTRGAASLSSTSDGRRCVLLSSRWHSRLRVPSTLP